MNAREEILARIREALRRPAPRRWERHDTAPTPTPDPTAFRQCLPAVPADFEGQCRLFAENAAALKADFHHVASVDEALAVVRRQAEAQHWSRVATHAGSLTDPVCERLGLPLLHTDQAYDVAELERCDAGVTECEALIAQTGSVLVSTRRSGGRALSVLPPHHVVLATREQLLPDLPAAFEHLRRAYPDTPPSCLCLVTGPSRTGDIERILVLGAHGPRTLTLLLVDRV